MGADQSYPGSNVKVKVKNTFIEIDIPRDTRLRRTCSGPVLSSPNNCDDDLYNPKKLQKPRFNFLQDFDTNEQTEVDGKELNEEQERPQLCRWKTVDAFEDYQEPNRWGELESNIQAHGIDVEKWNGSPWDADVVTEPRERPYAYEVALPLIDVPDAMPVMWGMELINSGHGSSWADITYGDRSLESAPTESYAVESSLSFVGRYNWEQNKQPMRGDTHRNTHMDQSTRHQPQQIQPVEAQDNLTWTTRMLRNLPNDYTRQDLQELLDSKGIAYEFIYLPIDWRKGANLGYAFVSLVSQMEAERIKTLLDGFSEWKYSSEKKCEVAWGKPEQQSLHGNIERFRNSPVMHAEVPDECKPMLFQSGKRVVFPAPTKHLSLPRGFHKKLAGH